MSGQRVSAVVRADVADHIARRAAESGMTRSQYVANLAERDALADGGSVEIVVRVPAGAHVEVRG